MNLFNLNQTALPFKTDLKEHGYIEAGKVVGESIHLANTLNLITNRKIVSDKDDEAKQLAEKKKVEKQIVTAEQQKITAEAEVNDLKVKESTQDEKKQNKKGEMNELEIEKSKNVDKKNSKAVFNFWMILAVFIPTTIFLYCFYVSSFHNAFFRDIAKQVANANLNNIATVMNTVFNSAAFSEFNLHWFAPIIFFAFGMVLHLFFDSTSKWRYLWVAATVVFIFFADGLLAYFIEASNHRLEVLMGLNKGEWIFYKSPVFIMVLVMGFFTCIGWSILLHKLREQHELINSQAFLRKKMSLIRKEIEDIDAHISKLQSEILKCVAGVEKLNLKIESLKKDLEMIHYGINELKINIEEFYSGWLKYILNLSNKDTIHKLIQECEAVKDRVLTEITQGKAA